MKFDTLIDAALLVTSVVLIYVSMASTGNAVIFYSYAIYPLFAFIVLVLIVMTKGR
jgi:hypothetical protein